MVRCCVSFQINLLASFLPLLSPYSIHRDLKLNPVSLSFWSPPADFPLPDVCLSQF